MKTSSIHTFKTGRIWINNVCRLFTFFVLIVLMTGCTGHLVRIKGECSVPVKNRISKGATFFVVENNTLHKTDKVKGIRNSIVSYLTANGFKAGSLREADFLLAIGYGIDADKKVREPVQMATLNAPYSGSVVSSTASSTPTVQPVVPGPISMMHTHSVFEVWMIVKLIDGVAYRETGQFTTIWTGKANIVENYPLSLEKTVDSMIPQILPRMGEVADLNIMIK